MKAVRAYGPKDYRLERDVPLPVPSEGEYLMQVKGVGICASDVKMFVGSDFYWGKNGRVKVHYSVIRIHHHIFMLSNFCFVYVTSLYQLFPDMNLPA